MNLCIFSGNLGKDAEVNYTKSGKSVVNFSLGCNERFKDQSGEWKEKTEWVRCVAWGKDKLAPYLLKGTKVLVQGKQQTRSWEKDGKTQYTTECNVFSIELLGDKKQGQGQQQNQQQNQQYQQMYNQAPPQQQQAPQQGSFPQSAEQVDDAPF